MASAAPLACVLAWAVGVAVVGRVPVHFSIDSKIRRNVNESTLRIPGIGFFQLAITSQSQSS